MDFAYNKLRLFLYNNNFTICFQQVAVQKHSHWSRYNFRMKKSCY